jgi:hypothetical protein
MPGSLARSSSGHQIVSLTCSHAGCGEQFQFSYNPSVTPFQQAPRGSPWPTSNCPEGHTFSYARKFKDPAKPGLWAIFD